MRDWKEFRAVPGVPFNRLGIGRSTQMAVPIIFSVAVLSTVKPCPPGLSPANGVTSRASGVRSEVRFNKEQDRES